MENLIAIVVGIICIFIGISNRKGNISSLHEYHRKRVAEEDVLPFGKMVGNGMLIMGVALILFGALCYLSVALQNDVYVIIGTVVLVAGIIVGCGLAFLAMKKYNKGIF